MAELIHQNKIYRLYDYPSEAEFEKTVIQYANDIFGSKALYIDIKKKIGEDNIVTIPDGYLIDFTFESQPRLYIVENELAIHNPYKHIGQQLLKFAISYRSSGRKIKGFLLENILKDTRTKELIDQFIERTDYRNIDDVLENLIFESEVAAVVVIDRITNDLESVLGQLTMKTDIIEFQTYISGDDVIQKITPFQEEIRSITENKVSTIKLEDADTIVVPANKEGFEEVFLGEDCWYAIRISSSMIDRIKYIASYETAPISAITHYAQVSKIEKYKNTDKYIIYFVEKAKKIGPIKLEVKKRGLAPQAPRYTTFERLKTAKTLSEVF